MGGEKDGIFTDGDTSTANEIIKLFGKSCYIFKRDGDYTSNQNWQKLYVFTNLNSKIFNEYEGLDVSSRVKAIQSKEIVESRRYA